MSIFKINTLSKRIGLGFLLLTLLIATTVLVNIWQTRNFGEISGRLTNLRVPTVVASSATLNGINASTAALRGWLLMKEDRFREDRSVRWETEIKPAMTDMMRLSKDWTDPESVLQINQLNTMMDRLEEEQNKVELLSFNDQSEAIALLETKVLPLASEIREVLNEMMDYQEKLMQSDFLIVNNRIEILIKMGWALLLGGIILSAIFSTVITRSVTIPVSGAVAVAREIGAGNLQTEVDIRGTLELERLGESLTAMRNSLRMRDEESKQFEWATTGQNRLYEVMREEKPVDDLLNEIIALITEYTQCNVGATYVLNDNGTAFRIAGKYALDSEYLKDFKMGEGFLGQVAADQTVRQLDLDEEHLLLRSSSVEAKPTHVLVVPFLYDRQTLGILELASFQPIKKQVVEFIESILESIGIAVYSAISRTRVKQLLEETQQQSEELQQQQEELEQSNAELEEQTQKLREQQEELQAANEELEEQTQVVEQKNSDLETARADIELKARQLEITSKYKSEFLANMSHELRTPLNSLLILSNDLVANKDNNLTDDQVESAQIITKSGYDLLNLINEILDLSKIESGKMELNIGEIHVQDLADDLVRNFRKAASDKNIELRAIIDPEMPVSFQSDRQRIDQVLKNLVSNSIKFTHNGSIVVRFGFDSGGYLSMAVEDTGIGIPKDKQDLIFEAFQQADGGTSRKYGGTGLGLSISRELAKLLGGQITLKSEPSKGSVFTLLISGNVSSAQNKAPARTATPPEPVEQATSKFLNHPTIDDDRENIAEGDRKVLIVEDDLNFARVLGAQAREKGFRFIGASSGEDGLMLAAKYKPHAIILDLELPGIDGHIVLRELKGDPELRHIPVHIISSNEKSLDPIRSGAVEYLTKPVSRMQLDEAFVRIEDFINRKMKNLLIIEDNAIMRQSIVKLIGNGDVKCMEAGSGKEALEMCQKETIDCIVLDIGLPDVSGFELIKQLESMNGKPMPPVIVYTGKELTKKETEELQEYAETVIVKGVKSEERLLDETALFLHRTVQNLPKPKQEMITSMYDKETMFHGKRVLVVDDDMRNVFALSKVLKEKGLEVMKAENGKVALDVLESNPNTDLVLMDIMMPEMDGYECMREIRKRKNMRGLPVIALTAKAMKDDRQKCIDAGANDYITKPVDLDRLLSLMRIWIKKK